MDQGSHAVEVTGLHPSSTAKDLNDFFSYCGAIENVDIIRSGDVACTAYVTFRDAYSQETAVLLSGASILNHRVCITRWGDHEEFDFWGANSDPSDQARSPSARAEEVVMAMLARGYSLGKDAVAKARAFDESHSVSSKVADALFAGMEAAKSVDQRFHVLETTKSAINATGRRVADVASSVVSSGYFSRGAFWVSGALDKAAKLAADLGSRGAAD